MASSEAALERHDAEEERDGRLAEENAELEAALKVETGMEVSKIAGRYEIMKI